MKRVLLGAAITAAMTAATSAAMATTLVTSLAGFSAGISTSAVTKTPNPGNFDLTQLFLPTTSTIALADGKTLGLANVAQVTQPQNGFPYLFADGFSGEVFVPQDALGNQVSTETITIGSGVSALGFEVAPFSNAAGAPYIGFAGGPYTVTVTLSTGQSQTVSLPGGKGGTTASQFFGFSGGGVSALTISTSDPNGLGFGNFVDVPEPASAALLLIGLTGLLGRRNRPGVV